MPVLPPRFSFSLTLSTILSSMSLSMMHNRTNFRPNRTLPGVSVPGLQYPVVTGFSNPYQFRKHPEYGNTKDLHLAMEGFMF